MKSQTSVIVFVLAAVLGGCGARTFEEDRGYEPEASNHNLPIGCSDDGSAPHCTYFAPDPVLFCANGTFVTTIGDIIDNGTYALKGDQITARMPHWNYSFSATFNADDDSLTLPDGTRLIRSREAWLTCPQNGPK